jgi:uncharacterized protein YndB with AHSA1/START domain
MSDETDMSLRLERLIAMQPDRLFALWTEPVQLAKWWAPDGYGAAHRNTPTSAGAAVEDLHCGSPGGTRLVLLQQRFRRRSSARQSHPRLVGLLRSHAGDLC